MRHAKKIFISLFAGVLGLLLNYSAYAIEDGRVSLFKFTVVKLDINNGDETCTGTLVGPQVIISAGHCQGEATFSHLGKTFQVNLIAHPSANAEAINSYLEENQTYPPGIVDLSLGVLNEKIHFGGYSKISSAKMNSNSKVYIYGYGQREYDPFGGDTSSFLIRGKSLISQVQDLFYVLSDPNHEIHSFSSILPGDSGGPTYDKHGDLVGVHSAANMEDGNEFWDVRLDTPEAQSFMKDFATRYQVKISGISDE